MGLKGYKPPEAKIELPGGQSMAVRGLNTDDIMSLVKNHFGPLSIAFARATRAVEEGLNFEEAEALSAIATDLGPECIADIIAHGANERDAVDAAKALPIGVQAVALDTIARLTFDSMGGVKNVVAIVVRTVQSAKNVSESLQLSTHG